ncbi:hypothetical protein ACHQM5_019873 [Ranunculus cassubicifolius]
MFYPKSVQSVFTLAKLQEATISVRGKPRGSRFNSPTNSMYSNMKYSSVGNNSVFSKSAPLSGSSDVVYAKQNSGQPPIKKLSPTEIQDRRSRGLCYNCDYVWSIKHKCQPKQVFLIVGDCEEATELSDTASVPVPSDSSAPANQQEIAISLQALSGNVSYQTMLLKGRVKNRNITMLVDTGSTHNFLDVNTTQALGCICSDTPAHQVMVAGGSHLTCDKVCQSFSWDINGVQFSSDVRLLSLGLLLWTLLEWN